ncbi:MAG: hypothetical protein FWH17_11480 [Oscillospiraceae bacterium]|nr:hypothetical protein [Oscillospiraceae bacterium]
MTAKYSLKKGELPMKKRVFMLFLLFALSLFTLTACVRLNINIGIDEDFTAYLSYTFDLDVSDIDDEYHAILSNAVNRFGWHYQEYLGFVVGVNTDSDIYTLTMRKAVANNTFEEAFAALRDMLTDEEITVFMYVDMVNQAFDREDRYKIAAALDIAQILRLSSIADLPEEIMSDLEETLKNCSGHITLSMPISELIDYTHDVEMLYSQAKMTVPLSYFEQTEFEFAAKVIYSKDGEMVSSLSELTDELARRQTFAYIGIAVAAAVLVIAVILKILGRRKENGF